MKRAIAVLAVLAGIAATCGAARAEWRPPDVRPTAATRQAVLAAYEAAVGPADARFAQRRERWTYVNGAHRLPVDVAVRDEDFRATVALGDARYPAGRIGGVRWRAGAGGISHVTLSDAQGDAIDRLPQSVFPFALAACELAGESTRFGAAWVLVDRAPRDKPHWLYVDQATGRVLHEITREGSRNVLTTFSAFDRVAGANRPRRWRVSDGDPSNEIDVSVDSVEPAALAAADVGMPQTRRTFDVPAAAAAGTVRLPARFGRNARIVVDVDLDGERTPFILDTGTAGITVDRATAERRGWSPVLEHAIVPRMAVGSLVQTRVSALTIPFGPGGLLGYDFFAGHVVHVDYERERVDVLTHAAAEAAFGDPANAVIDAAFDEGIPLVRGAFGTAAGDRFALDSGSPALYVFEPFVRSQSAEIDAHWSPATFPGGRASRAEHYLEGSIVVQARRVAAFTLGPWRFENAVVGVQQNAPGGEAIDIALDGIIGTDQMRRFEWWFDADGGRIAMRRNGAR